MTKCAISRSTPLIIPKPAQDPPYKPARLHDALFCETSPGPVKYAASLLGLCGTELRLPLCDIAESSKATVQAAMAQAGLLSGATQAVE